MKSVTIQDIADAAKVSKSTVSRVLNDTSAVHPEKRRAVLEATKRLGFKPNFLARSLAKGRSMTIGVLTQNMGSPFYDAISQGVIAGLSGSSYSPIFADGQWLKDQEVEGIRALLGRQVDGLVLIGGDLASQELQELCGNVPTIIVGRQLSKAHHHCVFTDNVRGGYVATKHLLEYGHREIAIICGISHHADAIDRLKGYEQALKEASVPFKSELVLDGDFTAESGVQAMERLISKKHLFTAVFACNDTMAFGARLALYRENLRVPEDVSLIGFDDQAESAFMSPPLTTVRQPARRMGAQASRSLLRLIDGLPFQTPSFEGELQCRDSVRQMQS